jgi:hypothetical protein
MADTPKSAYVVAREIAVRLERAGENPYSDQRSQYLVLGDDREGEILEFGRPLRAHRMFPVKTRAKNEAVANEVAPKLRQSQYCRPNDSPNPPRPSAGWHDCVSALRSISRQAAGLLGLPQCVPKTLNPTIVVMKSAQDGA